MRKRLEIWNRGGLTKERIWTSSKRTYFAKLDQLRYYLCDSRGWNRKPYTCRCPCTNKNISLNVSEEDYLERNQANVVYRHQKVLLLWPLLATRYKKLPLFFSDSDILHKKGGENEVPVEVNIAVLIPIKFPLESSRGPPLPWIHEHHWKCKSYIICNLQVMKGENPRENREERNQKQRIDIPNEIPVSRINSCICLYTPTNCDSGSTRYVSIQSAKNPDSESVIETKRISNS